MGLFNSKPVWMSENQKKALKAVERETDQTKLVYIIENASDITVCEAAVKKLTNEEVLVDIAKYFGIEGNIATQQRNHNKRVRIREAALDTLTNQEMIADVAKLHNDNRLVIFKVFGKLTDEKILADVVKKIINNGIISALPQELTNQEILLDIANCANNENIRFLAYKQLKDSHPSVVEAYKMLKQIIPWEERKKIAEAMIALSQNKPQALKPVSIWNFFKETIEAKHYVTDRVDFGIGMEFPPYPFED